MRSTTLGMPSWRSPPLALGMLTALTAPGLYVPVCSFSRIVSQCPRRCLALCSMSILSTPGAPPLAFTASHAARRFSTASTASSVAPLVSSSVIFLRLFSPWREACRARLQLWCASSAPVLLRRAWKLPQLPLHVRFARLPASFQRAGRLTTFSGSLTLRSSRFHGLLRYYGLC
jgi:hypothetical protein